MRPALNIFGTARVELVARTPDDLANEALTIFNAICNARQSAYGDVPSEANVCSGHKVLFRISRGRGSVRSRIYGYHRDYDSYFQKDPS